MWQGVQIHSFASEYLIVPAPFVEKTIYPYWIVLATLLEINWTYMQGSIWETLYSYDAYVYAYAKYHTISITVALYQVLKLKNLGPLTLFFFLKIVQLPWAPCILRDF